MPPKRSNLLPWKGKFFCCDQIALLGTEHVKERLCQELRTASGTVPPPGPIIGLAIESITHCQNLLHFLEWCKHYYNATPPLMSNREMNIDEKTWFVQVKELRTRKERYFFPEKESTPITNIAYSFLEVTKEDLTFPDKETRKFYSREIICPYPKDKIKLGENCPEFHAPYGKKKGRAYDLSVWERKKKVVEEAPAPAEKEKAKEAKAEAECVVPATSNIFSDPSEEANNEDSEDKEARAMELKELKEMLVVSTKVETERSKKAAKAYRKAKLEARMSSESLAKSLKN